MRAAILVVLVACTEHGSGGGVILPPPAPVETAPFFASLCTSGSPDDITNPNPNCPVNRVSLDDAVPGAAIQFVVRPFGVTLTIEDIALTSTSVVFHADHPQFLSARAGGQPVLTSDPFVDVSVEVFPGEPATLEGTVDLASAQTNDQVVIRFDALGEDVLEPDI